MQQTEYEFTLPCGYVDARGALHRDGVLRLATALDEVAAMEDPRVRANDAYLSILLLSRVVTRLGTLDQVTPAVIEQLFSLPGIGRMLVADVSARDLPKVQGELLALTGFVLIVGFVVDLTHRIIDPRQREAA